MQPPSGTTKVTVGGIALASTHTLDPGKTVKVECVTLCGNETVDAEVVVQERTMTANEVARRTQLVGSIQHVTRRACKKCRELYQTLDNEERRWLYSEVPNLGSIVGMDQTDAYGASLGPVTEDDLKLNAQDLDLQHKVFDPKIEAMRAARIAELRGKAGQ